MADLWQMALARRAATRKGAGRPKGGRLPDACVQQILRLHQEGMSFIEIARHTGVSDKTISHYTRAAGLPRPPPPSLAPQILALLQEGLVSSATIAQRVRCSRVYVCRVARKHGMALPKGRRGRRVP